MKKYSVIMAGGGGIRFWPLSRQNTPKQLLNLSGNDIMINETVKHCQDVISHNNIYIVINKMQEKLVKEVLIKDIPRENILVEPVARNTAPCILYAALTIMKRQGDGVMCVFPSDHYITDIHGFSVLLVRAINLAEETNKLITIGIKPKFPSTGYGYINYNKHISFNEAFEVREFVEKPSYEKAQNYIDSGNYLWNSGMFIWKVSVIIENFKRFLPRIYSYAEKIMEAYDTELERKVVEEIYPSLQNISIDYGIMERSSEVLVIPGDFGWSDVGSWDTLGSIFPTDKNGNIIRADFIGIDTNDSIIYGNGRLITTVGLESMIVVNTEDALLVCPKSRAQDVKKIVDRLREGNRTELL